MNLTKDDVASLISEDDAVLYKRRLKIKKELNLINKRLTKVDANIKSSMADSDFKSIESHGLKITYTKPRIYEDFANKKMVMDLIKEYGRTDLIEKKSGYSRMTISEAK